jgi:hypothetical protein
MTKPFSLSLKAEFEKSREVCGGISWDCTRPWGITNCSGNFVHHWHPERAQAYVDALEMAEAALKTATDNWCIKPECECWLCTALKRIHDRMRRVEYGKERENS